MLKYYINFLPLLVFTTVWSQTAVEKDSLPSELRYGLRLGIDISKPIRMLVEPTYKGLELVGDYRLTRNLYIAGELGNETKNVNQDGVHFETAGTYLKLGVDYKALTVDHLEELDKKDIEALKCSNTMPVALPACSYFLGIPYTPARKIIDAGLPLAIATDYNPGSTPSGNMNFVVSTACIKLKMTPEEAINAATVNGAYAMGFSNMYGSITRGKKANIIITKPMDSYAQIPYEFAHDPIDTVIINGQVLVK